MKVKAKTKPEKNDRGKCLLCRVCGQEFSLGTPFERIVDHLESRHPLEAMPWLYEFAELERQAEAIG